MKRKLTAFDVRFVQVVVSVVDCFVVSSALYGVVVLFDISACYTLSWFILSEYYQLSLDELPHDVVVLVQFLYAFVIGFWFCTKISL